MKYCRYILLLLITCFTLASCQKPAKDENTVVVGTISGPETELMEVAKKVAKEKYNLNVKIVEFTDFSLPNTALNDGSLDANAFQHKAFLDNEIKAKGYRLIIIGYTYIYPMGIYSNKIKKISDLPQNAVVAIPNDASNEARALLLLNQAQLIKLKDGSDVNSTPKDIVSNPKNLQFKELDASQLPRVLPDVDIAIINTNFAIPAGLTPSKDAIFLEDKNSPYVNLIVTRAENADNSQLKDLVKAYQSEEVKQKAKELFKGQAVPAWN